MATPAEHHDPTSNPVQQVDPAPVPGIGEVLARQNKAIARQLKLPEHAEHKERFSKRSGPVGRIHHSYADDLETPAAYPGQHTDNEDQWAIVQRLHHGKAPAAPGTNDAPEALSLTDLYRAYKHTPHQPASVFLKYLVHRVNRLGEYDDPKRGLQADFDFLAHHQKGDAALKNGHLVPADLHGWMGKHAGLAQELMAHRDQLQQQVRRGIGLNVRDINGEPYVALTRGLNSDLMDHEHALSSWADVPNTGFGSHMHHAWVPLRDIWYSYDLGPSAAGGNAGPENEWLVSHTLPRYEATAEDVKSSRFKDLEDEDPPPWYYDDATDQELAQGRYGDGSTPPTSDALNHPNAGPLTVAAFRRGYANQQNAEDMLLGTRHAPREQAMAAIVNAAVPRKSWALQNPNLTAQDLHQTIAHLGATGQLGQHADDILAHPRATTEHARALWQQVVGQQYGPLGLADSALTPPDVLDGIAQRYEAVQPGRGTEQEAAKLAAVKAARNPNATPELADRIAKTLIARGDFGHKTFAQGRWGAETVQALYELAGGARQDASRALEAIRAIDDLAENPDLPDDAVQALLDAYQKRPQVEDASQALLLMAQRHQKVPLSPAGQHRLLSAIDRNLSVKASRQDEQRASTTVQRAAEAGEELAKSRHLAPTVVQALAVHPNQSIRETLYRNRFVSSEQLVSAWPAQYGRIETAIGQNAPRDREAWAREPQRSPADVWPHLAAAVRDRRAYEKLRRERHLVQPWPQGLAKGETDWWKLKLEGWLSERARQAEHGGYYARCKDLDEARRAIQEKMLLPQPTDELLDGLAVFAHPAQDHHYHAWQDDPAGGDALLHFETDREPQQHSDGRFYWTEPVPLTSASIAGVRPDEPMDLAKSHGPFTFPKLGMPDDRRSVKSVTKPAEARTVNRAMANAVVRHVDGSGDAPEVRTHNIDRVQLAQGPAYGRTSRINPDLAMAISSDMRHAVAYDHTGGYDPVTEKDPRIGTAQLGTALHEAQHALFSRVVRRYGHEAHQNLLMNLHRALPRQQREAIDAYGQWRHGADDQNHEEKYTGLLNFLNNELERKGFFGSDYWKQQSGSAARMGIKESVYSSPEQFHTAMKRAYQSLRGMAGIADEAWLHPTSPWAPAFPGYSRSVAQVVRRLPRDDVKKSEESGDALNLPSRELEPGEHQTALAMLGHNPRHARALAAATFLVGRKRPVDQDAFRMALAALGGDEERAALHAVGLGDSEKNLRAIRAAIKLGQAGGCERELSKAEKKHEPISIHSVQPGNEDAIQAAQSVERAVHAGTVLHLHLNGKHSKGAMAARDPKSGYVWLLKPGAGKQSPAAGARDDQASQSRREAAFYHVAELCGLQGSIPRAELVMVNAQEWAAIKLLGPNWKALDEKNREKELYGREVLEPYLKDGLLHRFACLEWVCGNTDSHGQNILVNEGGSVALIDHGAAFAGRNFDPAHDPKSFIPFYLRCWAPDTDFKLFTPEQRLRFMPKLSTDDDQVLRKWLVEDLKPQALEQVLNKYSIDAKPALARLKELVTSQGNLSEYVCALWAGVKK